MHLICCILCNYKIVCINGLIECHYIIFLVNQYYKKISVSLMIPEDGCCSVRFTAVQRGHTTVTASYTSRGKELSASVTIAAYDPLMVKTCNLAF